MTERKWTKGPWVKDKHEQLKSPSGKQVGVWGAGLAWVSRDDEAEANAHLIAAAPDLYEALEAMLERHVIYCGGKKLPFAGHTDVKVFEIARAAIAKARGEK